MYDTIFHNIRDFLSNPWSIEFWSQQNNNLIVVTVTLKFKLANNQAEPRAHHSKLWVIKIINNL